MEDKVRSTLTTLILMITVVLISCSSTGNDENEINFQFPERVTLQEVAAFSEINEEQFFARPNIVVPLTGGQFIVADVQMLRLYHFDEAANLLGSYGRDGRGPGEFEQIRDVMVKGDSIKVMDGRGSRITTYAVEGELLSRVDISDFEYMMMEEHPAAMLREFIVNNDNTYSALYYDFNISSQVNPRVTKIVIQPYSASFQKDTTQHKFALDYIPEFEYEGGILSVPYYERGYYTKISGHLIYAVNNEPVLKLYNRSGVVEKEIILPDTRKELTSAEKEEVFVSTYRNAKEPERFRREVLSHMPDQRSIIRSLTADADDRIWVRIFRDESFTDDWLIFDEDGNALANLNIPKGHIFRNAKGNRVFLQRETEDGPEIVISEW